MAKKITTTEKVELLPVAIEEETADTLLIEPVELGDNEEYNQNLQPDLLDTLKAKAPEISPYGLGLKNKFIIGMEVQPVKSRTTQGT